MAVIEFPDNPFIRFERLPSTTITAKVVVINRRSGIRLGLIRWHGPWRQYVFVPTSDTIFNRTCLRDIEIAIERLTAERPAKGVV